MAGWKLRKDKTQGEMPEGDPDAPEAEPETAAGFAPLPSPEAPPDFEAEHELSFDDDAAGEEGAAFGGENGAVIGGENGAAFGAEDGPLTLMDYSAPSAVPLEPAPEPHFGAQVFERPVPSAAPEADNFTQTLRMSREELTAAFPAARAAPTIPSVAPFVLDIPASDDGAAPAPHLVIQIGRLSATFALRDGVTTIGRPDTALQYYPDVEIDMDDAVSRRHAEIIHRDDEYYLADAGSTNGTLLNGEALPPHEERLLAHGDRIRVGELTEIIFE